MGQVSYFAVKNHRWLNGLAAVIPAQYLDSERRVLPAGRDLDLGRQYFRDLSALVRHSRCPDSSRAEEQHQGAAHQPLPHRGSRRRSGAAQQHHNITMRLEEYGAHQPVRVQHSQSPREQGFPFGRRTEVHRFRHVQPVEFGDADGRRIQFGSTFSTSPVSRRR